MSDYGVDRVSVARTPGKLFIDADVTRWEMAEETNYEHEAADE